jgi:hypothetical protein
MSDIRLHTLRKSRNRNSYARLDHSEPQDHDITPPALVSGSRLDPSMRAPLNTASSARRVDERGRRRNQYGVGEPEEETTLLGEGERDPGFSHNEEDDGPVVPERASDAASQVRADECSIVTHSSDITSLLR